MITEKLTIYGDKENKECIMTLLEKCAQVLSPESMSVQVLTDTLPEDFCVSSDTQCVVLDYKDKEKLPEGVGVTTYSLSDSKSDVMALNIQNREQSVCFELLYKMFMSRVFIPHTRGYTPKQVLISSAVLLALGVPAEKIVETINEILK